MVRGELRIGIGLTVMTKSEDIPEQPFAETVIVIVAEIGEVPVFVAVNAGILPVPLIGNPIAELELVQVIVAPETGLPTVVIEVKSP